MKDILVGVNYFAGWWPENPNKWQRHKSSQTTEAGKDWRPEFQERVPLLGCFNDQQTMDKEIKSAANYGVNFFPILWYYNDPDSEREPNSSLLNNGVKNFANSKNSSMMSFFIEFCNHPPFEVTTEQQWQECLEEWIEYFKHPSYLKVGDRVVFKIHGADFFVEQNGDIGTCEKLIDSLRKACKDATGCDMVIGGGVLSLNRIEEKSDIANLFDFTCTYMDVPLHKQIEQDYPYEMLADLCRTARYNHCVDAIPYMPYMPGGWCPRPWPDQRAFYELPNRRQWSAELRRMKQDLLAMPNLGLPMPDGSIQPAFTCYAWNEFGEGGIIAPTQRYGYMKLEEIKAIFG